MKKLLLSCMMIIMTSFGLTSIAKAKTIDYLVLGTPGGSMYDNAEIFIPLLEAETGYKINKVVVDSCLGASIYLKSSKNPTIWIHASLLHEEAGCELQAKEETFIGVSWSKAMAFCSMDDLDTAVAKLRGGERLTFAVSNSYGQHLIDPLVKITGTPMKFVPYGSSGKSLKGYVAGDTDMLYTNMPKAISGVNKNGISCWLTTGPTKVMDMEPMKDVFPDYKYNDLTTFTYLDSANLSKSDLKKFRAAWKTIQSAESVTNKIAKKKLFSAATYGDNPDWIAILDASGKAWVGK